MNGNRYEVKGTCIPVSQLNTRLPREQRDRTHSALVVVENVFHRLVQARHRGAAIRELSRLDDHQLHDIGIEREQIPEVLSGMLRREASSDR